MDTTCGLPMTVPQTQPSLLRDLDEAQAQVPVALSSACLPPDEARKQVHAKSCKALPLALNGTDAAGCQGSCGDAEELLGTVMKESSAPCWPMFLYFEVVLAKSMLDCSRAA